MTRVRVLPAAVAMTATAAIALLVRLSTAAAPPPSNAQPAPGQAAAAPPLTLQDLQDVVRLGDLAWAPDGASLAFTVTPLLAGPSRTGSDVWLVEPGRGARALIRDPEPDRAGDFNPSGTHLSLSSRRAGDTSEQGWLWDRHDGALHPLAKVDGGLLAPPSWAPDAAVLAAIARPPGSTRTVDAADGTVMLLDPGGANAREVSGAPRAAALSWSPRAKTLALVARSDTGRRGLVLVQFEDDRARVRHLSPPPQGMVAAEPPAWSPAGTHIAARVELSSQRHELRVWTVAGKQTRAVSLPSNDRFGPPAWSADSTRLLLPLRDGLRVHIVELGVEAAAGAATGAPKDSLGLRALTSGLECAAHLDRPGGVAVARGGQRVAFVRASPRGPDEIFLLSDPQPQKLTAFHTPLLRRGLGSVEAAQLPPPAGPRPALLTYPAAAVAPQAPWPVLIVADGGSAPPSTAGFDVLSQLASSAGFLVMRAEWPRDAVACSDSAGAALAELRRRGLATAAPARWAGSTERLQELVRAGRIPADSFAFPGTEALDRRVMERLSIWLRAVSEK